MKMVYEKIDINPRVNGIYFTLRKVNLYFTFNDDKKYKSIPTEFIVTGLNWPDQFTEILLGSLWMLENGVSLNMRNSTLTLDDNFVIPYLANSQIRA
jgi:hypothetical protein